MLLDNNEPTSYGEAMVGPDSDEWLEAIKSKKGSMTLEEILDGDWSSDVCSSDLNPKRINASS